jgi:hypothetical protein
MRKRFGGAALLVAALALIVTAAAVAKGGPGGPGGVQFHNVFWQTGTTGDAGDQVTVTSKTTWKGGSPFETCTMNADKDFCTGTLFDYEKSTVDGKWYAKAKPSTPQGGEAACEAIGGTFHPGDSYEHAETILGWLEEDHPGEGPFEALWTCEWEHDSSSTAPPDELADACLEEGGDGGTHDEYYAGYWYFCAKSTSEPPTYQGTAACAASSGTFFPGASHENTASNLAALGEIHPGEAPFEALWTCVADLGEFPYDLAAACLGEGGDGGTRALWLTTLYFCAKGKPADE